MEDVVIVGGGAAGLMCATVAAERGLRVTLLEKMDQCGRKLRITGKGRCNLTNTTPLREALQHIGPDPRFLRNAFGRFHTAELMDFFERRGVPLKVERGNRVYPQSDRAHDIFMALISGLEANPNATIRKNATVRRVDQRDGHIEGVVLQNGERIGCRQVVLATGGLSYPTTGSTGAGLLFARELGHTIVDPVPALVALRVAERIPDELVGFTLRNVELRIAAPGEKPHRYFGELTFTDDGIGGPIALSASRAASRPLHSGVAMQAIIDLKPALTPEQLDRRLQTDLAANGTRIFNDALRLWLPAELIPLALPQLHIEYYKRLNQINGEERRKVGTWLKGVSFTLTGTRDYNEAIITQGGVSLSEVDPKTMKSRIVDGLYIVGELLDLDADTGGYNLQIAFSTAHAAGMALERL